MACKSRWMLVLIASTLPALDPARGQPSSPQPLDKETIARAALLAYAANISSFPYYKVRYRTTNASANSLEDALAGRFINARSFDKVLIVDGKKEFAKGFAPLPDSKKTVADSDGRGGTIDYPGDSEGYLSDGNFVFAFVPFMNTVNLKRGESGPAGWISQGPLDMGVVGHRNSRGPNILLSLTDKFDFSVVGMQDVLNRPVVTVRFDDKQIYRLPEGIFTNGQTFSFDRGRGYLPIRMSWLPNGKENSVIYIDRVRECSKQRWFPERVVQYSLSGSAPRIAREIQVLELEVDNRPKAEEFVHNVPAGTYIKEAGANRFFRLKQEESVTPEDLSKLHAMLQEVRNNPRMNTAIPRSNPYRWAWWTLCVLACIVAMAAALLVHRHWRTT